MKRILYLLFIVALIGKQVSGQDSPNPYDPAAKLLPPSPEAAAMQRFGETPVNLFKGEPSISVPIYSFKFRNLEVPIALNYNAGGFKVGELATAVGLGWSLQCGGMINVSTNGQSDFKEGIRKTPANIRTFSPINYPSADYTEAKAILEQNYDTEPDIFNYTYPGGSGKFIFNDSLTKIYTIPFSNVKIERIFGGFKIINESGVEYYYTTRELNHVTESCSLGSPNKRDLKDQIGTGWFLSKMVNPGGADSINFEYEAYDYAYREGRNETRFKYLPSSFCASQSGQFTNQERVCTRMMRYNTARVKKVKATGAGEVEFYYNNTRIDIDSASLNAEAKSLDSIVIRNAQTGIKSYRLQHSYFLSGDTSSVDTQDRALYRRLKLESIQEDDREPYTFKYNENVKLPFRLSASQDLLGYNSNAINSSGSMIPCIEGGNNYSNCTIRDISPFFNQDAFVLKKISYPTGGSSNFLYEQHTSTSTVMVYDTTYSSIGIEADLQEIVTDSVTAPVSSYNTLYINWGLPCENNREDGCSDGYIKFPDGSRLQLDSIGENGVITRTYQPGKYILRINSYHQFADFSYISMNWIDTVIGHLDTITKLHSGIRLKQMTDSAGFNLPAIVKEYTYPDINERRIVSYSEPIETRHCNSSIGGNVIYYCDYIRYNGTSVSPYGINTDFDYGYSTVNVETKSAAEPGLKEKYSFYVFPQGIDSIGEYNELLHYGKLRKKETYVYSTAESVYKKQMEEENFYTMRVDEDEFWDNQESSSNNVHQKFFQGLKLAYIHPEQEACDVFFITAQFSVEPYIKSTFWEYLNKTTSKQFRLPGDSLVTVKRFFYDSSSLNLPTRTEDVNSRQQSIITTLKYPHHFTSTSVYAEMVDRNMMAPVVEQIQNNVTLSKELSRTKTNYQFWNNDTLIESETIQSSIAGGALQTELTINSYDDKGNILQYTNKGGVVTSLIWGYNKQFPVAKIAGKAYSSAISESGINMSVVNDPLSDNALRTELEKLRTLSGLVLLNTYTYKPLVGVTSETDARGKTIYYEYDSAARLKQITDQDGKILKLFEYKYQVTNQQ